MTTELEKLKDDIVSACCRLHEHTMELQRLRQRGAPFEELERAMSDRRSLAKHLHYMRTSLLQPAVTRVETERTRQLPAEVAKLENRVNELRGKARQRLDGLLTEALTLCFVCGAGILPGGQGMTFRDSGLTQHLKAARAAAGRGEIPELEKKILELRFRLNHGANLGHEFEKVFGECWRRAQEQSGFDIMKDFHGVLDD